MNHYYKSMKNFPVGNSAGAYKSHDVDGTIVFPDLKWPPLFSNNSLMVILIEK